MGLKSLSKSLGNPLSSSLGNITDSFGLTNYSGDRALDAQRASAAQANELQKNMYDRAMADMDPYAKAGTTSLSSLADGSFMNNWQQDPGYQFRMNEGMKAINNASAARGMSNSGATMKALANYGQNQASNEYNNVYNRNYTNLSNLANMGFNASSNRSGYGQNYANSVGNNLIGVGNAAASNQLAQTQRMSNLIQGGMQGAGLLASDKRVKQNITPISKEDIAGFKSVIKPVTYEYIDASKDGEGIFPGIIAQDLEQSKLGKLIVFEDQHGTKKIDLQKAISLLLAIQGEGV
jgi:hypothetical protein